MRKVLMWAVGVPLLVFSMVVMSFNDGGSGLAVALQGMSRTR